VKRTLIGLLLLLGLTAGLAFAQSLPTVSLTVKDGAAAGKGELASSIKVVLLFTLLTLTPAILMLMTSFTRVIVSFHFLKQAIGLQGVPPNQVLIGLALFITLFIMTPVGMKIQKVALTPYNEGKIGETEALKLATGPVKDFMLQQTREKDLALFLELSRTPRPRSRADVDLLVLIPAYALSELKTAFQIGFLIYIPFLIIDVVVASILVSLGMVFLPPTMVSLPCKIVLFIIADGWFLLIGSLVKSFHLEGF